MIQLIARKERQLFDPFAAALWMEKQRKVIAKMVRSQTRKLNRFSLLNFRLLLASCVKGEEITLKIGKAAEISGAVWFAGVGAYVDGKNQGLVQNVEHRSCTRVRHTNFSINVSAKKLQMCRRPLCTHLRLRSKIWKGSNWVHKLQHPFFGDFYGFFCGMGKRFIQRCLRNILLWDYR